MTMNPLKYLGGLVLEIGAVVAALAFLPALGGSPAEFFSPTSSPSGSRGPAYGQALPNQAIPNQVFFDAQTPRVMDQAALNRQPVRGAWQNDFAPQPSAADQRFVESMLDHNSQRAMDTAARVWTRGDELLPPDLRVRGEANPPREMIPPREVRPLREVQSQPRTEYNPPSHYAPQRRVDDRY
jgi:hypothetical protein